jgi:hypothetical protein
MVLTGVNKHSRTPEDEMSETTNQRYGAGGWPLKPSAIWQGEDTLHCPKCDSEHVSLTSLGGFGPGGWRQGNPNPVSRIECNHCGHSTTY